MHATAHFSPLELKLCTALLDFDFKCINVGLHFCSRNHFSHTRSSRHIALIQTIKGCDTGVNLYMTVGKNQKSVIRNYLPESEIFESRHQMENNSQRCDFEWDRKH